MSGPLFLNPLMPTADSQAATKAYVDTMLATAGIPEVPPVPVGQVWARETGAWVPISQAEGTFLPISGGSMQGNINMSGNTLTNMAAVPAMPNGAAPAQWVLNQIASVSLYQGTWDADTNTPDLTQLSVRVNGYTWIAITTSVSGVVIGAAIPGLQGLTIYNGDTIIYSTAQGTFSSIHAGGLTLPEADARYVQLAGSQMSGALLLNSDATQPMQAVPYQQLEAAVANTVTPDAPADGQAYLRVGVGTNRWVPGLPLAGGILTGSLTLAGNATTALMPVPLQQMTSAITAAQAGLLPIAGGTMTGPIVLAGNATTNLNPVPLQQLNSMLGTYLPLSGGTLTGPLNLPAGTSAAPSLTFPGGAGGFYVNAGTIEASGNFTVGTNLGVNSSLTVVGTSSFSGTLIVNATAAIGGVNFGNNGALAAPGPGTSIFNGVTIPATNVILPSTNNAGNCGEPGQAWFQVAAYNFPNESDPRGKRDMQPAPAGALDKVKAIPVYNFTYASDPTRKLVTGFDATEVRQHHAHAVMTGEDEEKTLAINLPDMIALLWQAVQELSARPEDAA